LLIGLGGQVWLTGTDYNLFTAIKDKAQFFEVKNSVIVSASEAIQKDWLAASA
jgi:hypothetical protein